MQMPGEGPGRFISAADAAGRGRGRHGVRACHAVRQRR